MENLKRIFLLWIGIALFANTFSQEAGIRKNNFNLELGGVGIIYSVNYERIVFNKNMHNISGSIGFERITTSNMYVLQADYFYGKKHALDIGIAYWINPAAESKFIPRIGYRYQADSGFLFKIGFTPLINVDYYNNIPVLPYGGVAIGWSF